MVEEGDSIQGLTVDGIVGVSMQPDGRVALIVRNADTPIGLVFSPEDAEEAAALLASVNQDMGDGSAEL